MPLLTNYDNPCMIELLSVHYELDTVFNLLLENIRLYLTNVAEILCQGLLSAAEE